MKKLDTLRAADSRVKEFTAAGGTLGSFASGGSVRRLETRCAISGGTASPKPKPIPSSGRRGPTALGFHLLLRNSAVTRSQISAGVRTRLFKLAASSNLGATGDEQ